MKVAVNEYGLRIGQGHHNAKLTDADVRLIRQLHEEGMTYAQIAQKFDANRFHIGRICRYERRASFAVRFKDVPDCKEDEEPVEL